MKTRGSLSDPKVAEFYYLAATEDPILQTTEERHEKILDVNYTKVDIDELVEQLRLSVDAKKQLTQLLKRHPTIFGGGLGKLDIDPVSVRVAPDAKPVNQQYYSIPQAYVGTTKREIKRLCKIGVLKQVDHTTWSS